MTEGSRQKISKKADDDPKTNQHAEFRWLFRNLQRRAFEQIAESRRGDLDAAHVDTVAGRDDSIEGVEIARPAFGDSDEHGPAGQVGKIAALDHVGEGDRRDRARRAVKVQVIVLRAAMKAIQRIDQPAIAVAQLGRPWRQAAFQSGIVEKGVPNRQGGALDSARFRQQIVVGEQTFNLGTPASRRRLIQRV